MRAIERTVRVTETIEVEKTCVSENIASYHVDRINKRIDINVDWLDDQDVVIKQEYYVITGDDFIENPTERHLWTLIDDEREGENENE